LCDYTVVVPVYNEQDNLGYLYQELSEVFDNLGVTWEVIFVDDGSTDDSYAVLKKLHTSGKCIRVIRFRKNFGQTAAFAAGFNYAQGDYILTMDADGQNDPGDIPKFIEAMKSGDYDLVLGWRIDRKETILRRILSNVANLIISRSTRIRVRDRGCSLKLFKKELVKNIQLYGQMHRFLPELASTVGASVVEVPTRDRKRRSGRSKYGSISRTQRVLLDLVTVIFIMGYSNSPMQLFGSVALLSLSSGIVIASILAGVKIYYGLVSGWTAFHAYEIGNRPLLLLAVLLILLGVQFLMMGLLGEMVMRVYYEARNKPTYFIREVLD
jgi:glycosyltransferase involved in cell wall biosynthesis